ncbi:UbiA family prenyltransferase [Halomarina oriensis]|uniref:Ubiquinone biosynthesis protein UbiA n=1 Tax=Halomarina oriensis TaxID=671145 RepID=A0A6B0GNW3_9EURY|nr:UbiA family prenyltransferase [Halomarina oriensis]MWG33288.1 ubiquinone biosynthesis protein UbiA [Halomarina oriensis]
MAIARHGSGVGADVRALASQVHPVFMLPPVAASAFGAVLARSFDPAVALLYAVVVFSALFVAHVKDGYVDFHGRGEDDDHPLTARGCRLALAGASTVFFLGLVPIYLAAGPVAVALTLPGWLIGYHHAPRLDMHPVTATTGYPAGIGFALLGGYYVQAEALSTTVVAFAVVFVTVLSGIKVIDDAKDYEYDRSISKRTVAVVLGRERARTAAYALMATGMVVVTALAVSTSVFPTSSVLAVGVFVAVASLTRRMDARTTTAVLIRGSYLFLAALVVAVWFEPLR